MSTGGKISAKGFGLRVQEFRIKARVAGCRFVFPVSVAAYWEGLLGLDVGVLALCKFNSVSLRSFETKLRWNLNPNPSVFPV